MAATRAGKLLAAGIAAGIAAVLAPAPAPAARPNPHAELDCNYCHNDVPTFGVDTLETVNFWRAEGDEPALCLRCHAAERNLHPIGVEPGPERLGTHRSDLLPLGESPAVKGQVVCTTCHAVHAADAAFSLLRGFPGSRLKGPAFRTWQDLCRQCHGESLARRSPHAGDERSCVYCHGAKPVPGQPAALTPQATRLCAFCHGAFGAGHYAGVNPLPGRRECVDCHDPHLGTDHPARLRQGYFDPIRETVALDPHGRRTLCFACHPDDPPGARLRVQDPVGLCQRCHGSGAIPGMSHPMSPPAAGTTVPEGWPLHGGRVTCLTCHRPGHPGEAGGVPHLLRGGSADDRNEVCFICHDARRWEGRNPHREVAEAGTGCTTCHLGTPVWGRNLPEVIGFRADVNILCLACHDPAPHPGGFWHTLTLTADMPRAEPGLPLGRGDRITCATCHNPHLNRKDGHNLRGPKEPVPFCSRCHKIGSY